VTARAPAHCYVYYRVAADTAPARARIHALIAEVEARTGVHGSLLARCDDPSMWMEVYAPVARATAFRRTLAALAAKHGAALLAQDGRRHVETFGALPPLARRTQN
jgi:hypothetical protein